MNIFEDKLQPTSVRFEDIGNTDINRIEEKGFKKFPYYDGFQPVKKQRINGKTFQVIKPSSYIIIGSSGSGKTAGMSAFISFKLQKYFHKIYIISNTVNSESNKHYWDLLDKNKTIFIENWENDPDHISDSKQKCGEDALIELIQKQRKTFKIQGWYMSVLVFIDDYNIRAPVLNQLYTFGRHIGITPMMSLHDIYAISKPIKQNVKRVFYFETLGKSHQIREHFLYPYLPIDNNNDIKKARREAFEVLHIKYNCIVIEPIQKVIACWRIPNNQVKFFKAKEPYSKRKQLKTYKLK